MTADDVTIEAPKHPLYALTTSELSRYRRELETAIRGISDDAPIQPTLRSKLDAVLAEQEDRAKVTDYA